MIRPFLLPRLEREARKSRSVCVISTNALNLKFKRLKVPIAHPSNPPLEDPMNSYPPTPMISSLPKYSDGRISSLPRLKLTLIRIVPIAVSLLILMVASAHAASGTWSATPTNGNWEATGSENNWSNGPGLFPGSTTTTNNAETATFTSSTTTSVLINSTAGNSSALNIKGITFGAASATTPLNSFTIGTTGGNELLLTSGGAVTFLANTASTGITETVNAPIVIGTGSAAQTYSFTNSNATSSNILVFGGAISGGTTGTTTLTLNGANTGANAVNGIISNGSGTVAVTQTLGSWTLGGANTYTGVTTITGGTLSISADDNLGTAPGTATPGDIVLNGGTLAATSSFVLNSNRGIAIGSTAGSTISVFSGKQLTYNGIIGNYNGSSGALIVNGGGTLVLGGANTYLGTTLINGGATLSTGATGYLADAGVASSIGATSYYGQQFTLDGGTFQDANTSSAAQITNRLFQINAGGGTFDASGAGNLTFDRSGATVLVMGVGARTLTLTGTNTTANTIAPNLTDSTTTGGGVLSLAKTGLGTWALSGANTYTGGTTISAGTLIAKNASALGSGTAVSNNVVLAAGAGLDYEAAANNAKLTIGGGLTITGGAGTTLEGSIGSSTTADEINVVGAATLTDAPLTVNIYGVSGVATVTGTYTILHGGAGSSLNPATAPTLGLVYNNSNFTVGALSNTATDLQVSITSQTVLPTVYWKGGLSGAANVWAVSNGTTASNWSATAGGSVQALTPGSTTDVVISATSPTTAPISTTLGADMSIKGLTISDTTNGLGLNADGNTLTIGADGITVATNVPLASIAANVSVGTNETWTNNSTASPLLISGYVTGAANASLLVTGAGNTTISSVLGITGSLTKSGSGTFTLSGIDPNTYAGLTTVTGGELDLNKSGVLASQGAFTVGSGTGVAATLKLLASNQIVSTGKTLTINSDGTLALGANSNTVATLVSTGGTITGSGGVLTATAAPTFNGTNVTSTIGAGATVASTAQATVAATDGLTLNGTLSDAAGISLTNGATTLSGTGTVTGAVTLNGGGNTVSSTGTLTTGGLSVGGSGNTITSGIITGGGTIASAGTLVVNSGATLTGSLGVSSGGTLSGQGTVGNTTVATGGAINLQDSSVGTLHTGTLSLGAGTGTALSFDIQTVSGTTSVDSIAAGTLTITGAGGIVINIGSLAGTSALDTGIYTLISDTNGAALGTDPFTFTGGASSITLDGSTLTLINSASGLELNVAPTPPTPAVAYWSGSANASWQTVGNFNTTPTSGTTVGTLPGSTTDVVFSTSTPVAGNLNTTLDAATSINSLHFNSSSGNVTIASGTGGTASTLTIGAATTTGSGGVNTAPAGITLDSGAGDVAISAPVVLGASQTWTTSGSTSLAVSGAVSDGGNTRSLTKDGTGVLTLSGQNTYSGGTTVSSGTLVLSNGSGTGTTTALNNANGSATGSGALSVAAGATLAGKGTSQGSSFSISGASGSKAQVLVGQVNAADLNTTGQLTLLGGTAPGNSTIANANLTFNLNTAAVGESNKLNVGATGIAFGAGVTLTLNLQNTSIIPAHSDYVLIAGTAVGTSAATSQYSGPDVLRPEHRHPRHRPDHQD